MPIKVLWLEDESGLYEYETTIAEDAGWDITTIKNAADAFTTLQRIKFDLVIVDLIIPVDAFAEQHKEVNVTGGIEFVAIVRGLTDSATKPDVRIIVITARISPNVKEQLLPFLLSERDYWVKPLDTFAFESLIETLPNQLSVTELNEVSE